MLSTLIFIIFQFMAFFPPVLFDCLEGLYLGRLLLSWSFGYRKEVFLTILASVPVGISGLPVSPGPSWRQEENPENSPPYRFSDPEVWLVCHLFSTFRGLFGLFCVQVLLTK